LFDASSILARVAAASVLILSLAACGGGGVMSSFDAEKSRLRGALPGAVECAEQGTMVICSGYGERFHATVGTAVGHLQVTMDAASQDADAYHAFLVVAAAYGMDEDEAGTCHQGRFVETQPTYRLSCTRNTFGNDMTVTIDAVRPV
jgi:hypothetical protein